jgi:CBS domain containing-hemolysin-like protein
MVFVERHKTLRQCLSLALRSGFSRIPVTGEDVDDVVGVVYLKDVVRRVYDRREAESTERVDSVMRSPMFVPDSKPVDELLREMQAGRTHVAVVVDEYGGTAGLVTIEDVLEEIVGEIDDEYDLAAEAVHHFPDGSVRVSSRMNIEEVGDLFGLELTDDDVDSVGGLLAKHLGRVPIPGSRVEVGGLAFRAESAAGRRNRVGTVLVRRAGEPDDVGSEPPAEAAGRSASAAPQS